MGTNLDLAVFPTCKNLLQDVRPVIDNGFLCRGGTHNEDVGYLECNPDFSRCAVLLNAQIPGIPTATYKLAYDYVEHTILDQRMRHCPT